MLRPAVFLLGLAAVAPAAPADPLEGLRQDHPRLIALDSEIVRLRDLIRRDAGAKALYAQLRESGEELLKAAPLDYTLKTPPLITQGKRAAERIYNLALLYRLDGKKEYARRAVRELQALAALPDWNPEHFLDTAQLAEAFGIGYDWLYPALEPGERAWIRRAIVAKALDEARPYYRNGRTWAVSPHNWNLVCNGGVGIGVLAIAAEEPGTAREFLGYIDRSMKLAMASYGPDGAWKEGPSYWQYATRYAVHLLAAMETALGRDYGLSAMPGFSRAGHFRIYAEGPTGLSFNFSDGSARVGATPELLWLARRFNEPVYAGFGRRLASGDHANALDLLWYAQRGALPGSVAWPLGSYFKGVEVVSLRTSWDDPEAIFVAVKGGQTEEGKGHTHLDLGSFVLDAGGVRWALDLGSQKYGAPEYFGKLRWTYFRTRTESHNTILIDGENQDLAGHAVVTAHRFDPDFAFARIDLSNAYSKRVARLERGVALYKGRHVIVQDEVAAPAPVAVLWGMITDAAVRVNGRAAELRKNGWTLNARILAPEDAAFEVLSTAVSPPQTSNEGTLKLVARLPRKVSAARVVVLMTPHRDGAAAPEPAWEDRALAQWPGVH